MQVEVKDKINVGCKVSSTDILIARIRKHNGNEEAALQLLLEYSEHRSNCLLGSGGIANYVKLLDSIQTPSSPMKPVADACDRCLCCLYFRSKRLLLHVRLRMVT